MDKLEKALRKLTQKERENIEELLRTLASNNTQHLDIKKLKGYEDIFRVRKGSLRIMYRKDTGGEISVLAIERRGENTYRNF